MNTKWIVGPAVAAFALLAALFVLAGCSKQGSVDTSAMENSFKTAEPTLRTSADKVVAAVKSADYAGAMAELKTLAGNAKLTPEQQQSLKDLMAQVQKAITDAAAKATGDATKAADDLKKSLPK